MELGRTFAFELARPLHYLGLGKQKQARAYEVPRADVGESNMKRNTILSIIAMTALAFSVGCGKMQGASSGSSTTASVNSASTATNLVNQTQQDIAAFNQQNTALQTQVDGLNTQINSINLPFLESGGTTGAVVAASQMRAGAPARIRSIQSTISNVLNGVYTGVSDLYTKINDLQTKIQNRIAQLNLNDPAQLAAATALEASLTYLAQARAKLDTLVNTLVTKVQGFTASIDTKLASLNQSNPLTWVAEVYWAQLKVLFTNFESELTALTQ